MCQGRLTALSALTAIRRLSAAPPFLDKLAHGSDVMIAGHSMGGHGAWHLATTIRGNLTALLPAAGWLSKEDYGDSNILFRHDVGVAYSDPAVRAVIESSFYEHDADKHAQNLRHAPILARVGSVDRTVLPFYQRKMRRILQGIGVHNDVTVNEIKDKGHWWWDTKKSNDGGAVFDADVRAFIAVHALRSPHLAPAQCIDYLVSNPATFAVLEGLQVLQLQVPFRKAVLRVCVVNGSLIVSTTNIARIVISEVVGGRALSIDDVAIKVGR